MSIKDFIKKSKRFVDENAYIFIVLIIVFVAFGSFGLGRLSKIDESKIPLHIEGLTASVVNANKNDKNIIFGRNIEPKIPSKLAGTYVGSKTGKKYHFPWCSGARRIKENNKIIFKTIEEARKAGYTPAVNCKGLR